MKSEKYASGKQRKLQQLVASTDTPNIGKGIKGRKSGKRRTLKFNCENVPSNSNKISPRSRQTVLSEYFTSPGKQSSPKDTPSLCKPDPDDNDNDAAQKMINVPQLLHQLLRARVVLNRIQPSSVKETAELLIKPRRSSITRTGSSVVQRYCCKCKILETDHSNITKRKLCRRCGTLLVYVCVKCNAAHFVKNRHMRKHLGLCKGNNGDSTVMDALDSVAVIYCADCPFVTTHTTTMRIHMKHRDHKMLDGEKVLQGERMGEEDTISKEDPRIKFIVKQNNDSSRKGMKRYCPKCKKVVIGQRSKNEASCVKCDTRLLFKCGKCNYKCNFYKTLYYHVKVRCYASDVYQCKKCNYTSPLWQTMSNHLKTQKCSTIPNEKKKV